MTSLGAYTSGFNKEDGRCVVTDPLQACTRKLLAVLEIYGSCH